MLYRIAKIFLTVLFKVFFRLEVFGRGHIPQKGKFILASNHTSYLDPIVLGIACPRELNFMAKEELFKNRLFCWLITTLGAFSLKRGGSDFKAIKEAGRRLKEDKALVLFPEGERQTNAVLGRPQQGVGFLAAKFDAPIIPVFIRGPEIALPAKGAKFIRFHKISVYFGKQIIVERRMAYQDIALKTMEAIGYLSCSRSN